MKRTCIISIFFSLLFSVQAQSHSWDGAIGGISPNAHFRALNIYVNVIYDEHPDTNNMFTNTTYWGPVTDTLKEGINKLGTIPTYLLSLFDTAYVIGNTNGCITRIYGESSFDTLQISGDNVVVNVRESRVIADPTPPIHTYCQTSPFCYNKIKKVAIDVINEAGGLKTVFGHDSLSDYSLPGSQTLYYTNVLIRNITKNYGGLGNGSGRGSTTIQGLKIGDHYYSSQHGTLQCIGDGNFSTNPTGVLTHEIGHSLFGNNNFHTSGGNNRADANTMTSMNIQGGYGLMGAAGSGLVSCNGYDRWRMHWKHPSAPYYICARDFANIGFANSDISKEDGNKWFTLRDFVTYGDAIRIKLPYKDSTITPNQYIWLEFHNVGHNDKLDFLQYSDSTCLYKGTPGIYAYYQIGRDVLESTNRDSVWDKINRDNLRIISNEGFWDYVQYPLPYATDFVCTGWNWEDCYYTPEYSNPFCGYQDQEMFIVPKWYDTDLGSTVDSVFENGQFVRTERVIREIATHNMIKNGEQVSHSISWLGDSLDAFSSHRKINMGTNPSTCNAKTYYTNSIGKTRFTFGANTDKNNTTTYLTGLSIEMTPIGNGDRWRVHIRWDDYDIVNDARWTGKIVLKGTEQVNLTRGNSITLAQNRTPAQRYRNTESGYFADPTKLTCEAGSIFTQQPQSSLVLTEKSRFVLDNGATYHLGDSAQILVQGQSTFTINPGADFTGGVASEIIVDSLSTLYVYDTVRLCREARIIVRPGGKLIVNGGTLTSACDGEMWQGIIVEGHSDQRQLGTKQGSVILANATIENARVSISTHTANDSIWVGGGGIVQATNTLFRNNGLSVELTPYENHKANGEVRSNVSYFTRCTFTADNDNLFADNATSFEEHVFLWSVRGVKFNGCTFRNEVTATSGLARGHAIRSMVAGFIAQRVCPQVSNIDPCGCLPSGSDTVTRCSFTGFHSAISAANSEANYDITIDNCDFAQNKYGVDMAVCDNVQVSFCDFNLDHTVNENTGLSMKNCTGYTVESNSFYRTHFTSLTCTGISIDSSGTAENVIRLNDFSKLKYGCYAWNRNAGNVGRISPGLQYTCNDFDSCRYSIYVRTAAKIRVAQGSPSLGADNTFLHQVGSGSMGRSITIPSDHENVKYYYSSGHAPISTSNCTLTQVDSANSCLSSLCGTQMPPIPRDSESALTQYRAMAEVLRAFSDTIGNRPDDPQDAETAALQMQLSDLSAAMGDLARTAIRAILSDTVVDMTLLKEWYGTIVETMCTSSLQQEQNTSIPVEAYQLAEVYSTEGDYAAADALLASLPQRFSPDEPSRNEYGNYLNLQRLRENVAGNWYRQTDAEIADLQQVAEYDNGRAARMAKEILCFFHHICYEDEPLFDLDGGIGERGLRGDASQGDAVHHVSTPDADGLRLHPNPANTTLTVESDSPVRAITIYDLTGRTMLTVENCPSPATINVVSLPRGIYLLRAVTEEGVKTARFVKN